MEIESDLAAMNRSLKRGDYRAVADSMAAISAKMSAAHAEMFPDTEEEPDPFAYPPGWLDQPVKSDRPWWRFW